MSCTVTGRTVLPTPGGATSPLASKLIIIVPSRDDFEFSLDSGTTWQAWEGDPNLATTYPGGVSTQSNGTGDWGFVLPWTDATTEVRLPGGAPVPGLFWNIIDPNPATGVRTIYGETKQAVVSSAKTTKQLITLSSPDTWQVGSVTYHAVPEGPRRFCSVPFTSAGNTAGLSFADIGTSSWKFGHGIESDDSEETYYVARVVTGSKTNTAGTIRLSDVPPVGKTVLVHVEIYV